MRGLHFLLQLSKVVRFFLFYRTLSFELSTEVSFHFISSHFLSNFQLLLFTFDSIDQIDACRWLVKNARNWSQWLFFDPTKRRITLSPLRFFCQKVLKQKQTEVCQPFTYVKIKLQSLKLLRMDKQLFLNNYVTYGIFLTSSNRLVRQVGPFDRRFESLHGFIQKVSRLLVCTSFSLALVFALFCKLGSLMLVTANT